jgi:hypothetical protein
LAVILVKSILETKATGFIGEFEVQLNNHYGGHVIKTASGHNLIPESCTKLLANAPTACETL